MPSKDLELEHGHRVPAGSALFAVVAGRQGRAKALEVDDIPQAAQKVVWRYKLSVDLPFGLGERHETLFFQHGCSLHEQPALYLMAAFLFQQRPQTPPPRTH